MLGVFDERAEDLIWGTDGNALISSSFIFPTATPGKSVADMCREAGARSLRAWIPANETRLPALFRPTMRLTVSNTGSFCSTRATMHSWPNR
jgi:hypothetical protein